MYQLELDFVSVQNTPRQNTHAVPFHPCLMDCPPHKPCANLAQSDHPHWDAWILKCELELAQTNAKRLTFVRSRCCQELFLSRVIEQNGRLIVNRKSSPNTQFSLTLHPHHRETNRKSPRCLMNGSIKLICESARGRLAHHVSLE